LQLWSSIHTESYLKSHGKGISNGLTHIHTRTASVNITVRLGPDTIR